MGMCEPCAHGTGKLLHLRAEAESKFLALEQQQHEEQAEATLKLDGLRAADELVWQVTHHIAMADYPSYSSCSLFIVLVMAGNPLHSQSFSQSVLLSFYQKL